MLDLFQRKSRVEKGRLRDGSGFVPNQGKHASLEWVWIRESGA
jgi:hypothetical protein